MKLKVYGIILVLSINFFLHGADKADETPQPGQQKAETESKKETGKTDKGKRKNFDGNKAVILCFHDIDGAGIYSINSEEFSSILDLLKNRFEVLSLKDWRQKVDSGQVFTRPPVILTFDDGYNSIYSKVIPLLTERKFGATFFIYLDRYNAKPEAYSVLSNLSSRFEVGSHSFSHANMLDVYKVDQEQFFKEIFLSKKKLEYLLNREVISWAWPFGFHNNELLKMAEYAGYSIQVTTGFRDKTDGVQNHVFSRYTVQNPAPVDQVKEILKYNFHM